MLYGASRFGSFDEAKTHAACACPSAANGWYSIGTSACGDGVAWAGVNADATLGRGPSLALGEDGRAFVAFTDQYPNAQVVAWRAASGIWDAAGPTSAVVGVGTGGNARTPVLGYVLPGGTAPSGLRVAWTELNTSSNLQIYFARLDVGQVAWLSEGTNGSDASNSGNGVSGNGTNDATLPSLAVSANGNHLIAWQDSGGIWARYLNSGSWMPIGATGVTGGMTSVPPFTRVSVANSPGAFPMFAAWQTGTGLCISFRQSVTGATWQSLGSSPVSDECPGLSGAGTSEIAPVVAASGSEPIVAWQSTATPLGIRIRHYVANTWKGFGTDTEYSTVSMTSETPAAPAIAVTGTAEPVIAYEAGATSSILVRKWDGMSWAGLGNSAATATGGISGSGVLGRAANVVVGPSPRDPAIQAVCVAWVNGSSSNVKPFLRCFDLQ
jgi:hypothetical protein